MSVLTNNQLTISEQIKQFGPSGEIMDIVNVLVEENELLLEGIFLEANEMFSNLAVKTLSLPDIDTRRINDGSGGGVTKSTRQREVVQIFESLIDIDELLLKSVPAGGKEKARWNQVLGFVESFAQAQADALIYGSNATDPDEIDGLTTRYNDTSLANVHDVGGSGDDTTSLWLLQWDRNRLHMIYPRATENCGLYQHDEGRVRVTNSDSGKAYYAYETLLRMGFGWNIVDGGNKYCAQRLVNIESSAATGDDRLFSTGKINLLISAVNKLPKKGKGAVIYCNGDLKTQFDIYAKDHLGGVLWSKDAFGQPVSMYQGRIPIRIVDAISSEETAI
jgi:hypothetical protein